jgi:NAD(P)-dependent dehydrogenase (short-subunit alcohol dehydrogenase family)
MTDMAVWFVTGASRGLGLEIARQALERGDCVVATARDPRRAGAALPGFGERLLPAALDVTDPAQAARAVETALARFGRIDVLVNNAGYGLLGAVEEASPAEVESIFATNLFGLLAVTKAVLPVMRGQRSGRIINMSSVGGVIGLPGWGVYGAAKFAVEGLSEALRSELAPLGIDVVIIEPGGFRTDFLDDNSLHRTASTIADYGQTVGRTRTWADENNHRQVNDPVAGASVIIRVATAARPPSRLQLGADCVAAVEAKLLRMADELDQWRDLSSSTAHGEAAG